MNEVNLDSNNAESFCNFCKNYHGKIHSDFSFMTNFNVIVINDLNKGNKSVTNDIEYVLFEITKYLKMLYRPNKFNLDYFKIIYRDSMGTYDQVMLKKNGKFDKYQSLNKTDVNEAMRCVSDKVIPL